MLQCVCVFRLKRCTGFKKLFLNKDKEPYIVFLGEREASEFSSSPTHSFSWKGKKDINESAASADKTTPVIAHNDFK